MDGQERGVHETVLASLVTSRIATSSSSVPDSNRRLIKGTDRSRNGTTYLSNARIKNTKATS